MLTKNIPLSFAQLQNKSNKRAIRSCRRRRRRRLGVTRPGAELYRLRLQGQ